MPSTAESLHDPCDQALCAQAPLPPKVMEDSSDGEDEGEEGGDGMAVEGGGAGSVSRQVRAPPPCEVAYDGRGVRL
jgi:hypothetical protein